MRGLRIVGRVAGVALMLAGAIMCLRIGGAAPHQPEYWYSGGACNLAMCGELVDTPAWVAAWEPWAFGLGVFLAGQFLLVGTSPAPPRPDTTPAQDVARAALAGAVVFVTAGVWHWSVEMFGALSGGYHTGVFLTLAASVPLWLVLFRWVPGQASTEVRIVTLAAAHLYGLVMVVPLLSRAFAHLGTAPRLDHGSPAFTLAALAGAAASLIGAVVSRWRGGPEPAGRGTEPRAGQRTRPAGRST
ncbi:hypothetical protein G7070_16070 [Propioniciclava coleopterorum]|uniref:DUF998 domain-containing protein n=1 Tax=Propioniciclava coleopterorum TaxID=2714937 RepID=A0A6G7YA26_9ACTN|nr:hypothetical protein [Propioniciclava coleopterorum]QIK73498.1 hypothetical protein G7070_16070 [Propioniciclava coleopterorum]